MNSSDVLLALSVFGLTHLCSTSVPPPDNDVQLDVRQTNLPGSITDSLWPRAIAFPVGC